MVIAYMGLRGYAAVLECGDRSDGRGCDKLQGEGGGVSEQVRKRNENRARLLEALHFYGPQGRTGLSRRPNH